MQKKNSLFAVMILASALLLSTDVVDCCASGGDIQKEKSVCLSMREGDLKGILAKLNIPDAKILTIDKSPV
ncbi:MAG: hypothetical protein NT022_01180, partial [Deltaproteobacteria bacterium]|nr:hypothetical protein [Deltaproteobacteria bacterium]